MTGNARVLFTYSAQRLKQGEWWELRLVLIVGMMRLQSPKAVTIVQSSFGARIDKLFLLATRSLSTAANKRYILATDVTHGPAAASRQPRSIGHATVLCFCFYATPAYEWMSFHPPRNQSVAKVRYRNCKRQTTAANKDNWLETMSGRRRAPVLRAVMRCGGQDFIDWTRGAANWRIGLPLESSSGALPIITQCHCAAPAFTIERSQDAAELAIRQCFDR